jgi:predicted PP-loop superfamily ATPase
MVFMGYAERDKIINKNTMMTTEVRTCSKCLLNEKIEGVMIGEDGICNYCTNHKAFAPYGENELLKIFSKARKKNRIYDTLVPISGGKDSTYVLYLAVKVYKLKVLTYTFDNGFMSDMAKNNIERSVKICGVDHIWVKHDVKLIRELYKTTLLNSGEICGICGIGIERSMLKISEAWKIPLILLGHSPTEANSFTSENLYDQSRLKAILANNHNINKEMINRFLIYPGLNFISSYLFTLSGRFGKKVNILYYLNIPTDKEIGEIIKKEMNWIEPGQSEYTRHFDCIAEPFTNYVREKRFGISRRLPQLSNMIRNQEISREEASRICMEDNKKLLPENYKEVMLAFDLTETDLAAIENIPANVFNDKKSTANALFAKARGILKKNAH